MVMMEVSEFAGKGQTQDFGVLAPKANNHVSRRFVPDFSPNTCDGAVSRASTRESRENLINKCVFCLPPWS